MNKLIKQAFTLIELLVVIAIIGILSGLIIVSMGGMTTKATIAKAQVFSNSLRNSLMMNIIGEWKFDSVAGIVGSALTDGTVVTDSWSTNNGTTSGGPILKNGADCVSGQCLQFDGSNDYVGIANSATLDLLSPITLAFWFNPSTVSVATSFIVDSRQIVNANSGFYITYDNRALSMYVNNNTGSGSYTLPAINRWYYIVGTYDKSLALNNIKLYVDGALQKQADYNNEIALTNRVTTIGSRMTGLTNFFNGLIDDVRIYNAAMPTSRIKEQYYAGLNQLLNGGSITQEEYSQRVSELAKN